MKAKKVLFIEAGTDGGGSFESLYQFLKILDRNKVLPYVIYFNNTKYVKLWSDLKIPAFFIKDRIYSKSDTSKTSFFFKKIRSLLSKVPSLPFIFLLNFLHRRTIIEIRTFIKEHSIDLVYLNNQILRDLVFVLACKNTGVKIISHQRSVRGNGFSKKMARYSNDKVDVFIANSKNSLDHWLALGLDPLKTKLLYNFIEPNIAAQPIKKQQGKIVNIGTLANFTEAKGHSFLLEGIKSIMLEDTDLQLFLGGQGHLKQELQAKVAEVGLSDRVHFLGYVNRSDFFRKIDVLIVPSKSETFGRVIVEAMQESIPVIATNIGGIPEIISNEFNGLLIEYGDVGGMRKALILLSKNISLRENMIANGKKMIEEKFSSKSYMSQIDKIFQTLS